MFNQELFAKALIKVPEKYLLVNLAAMRTRQLIHGADPLVDPEDLLPLDIALKEICADMISIGPAEETVEEDIFSI